MIDFGLLFSMIISFGIPSLVINWWPLSSYDEPVGFVDVAIAPAIGGLAVGRVTTLALDDPGSIGSISDMLIIRSGVEFWPGVATAAAMLWLSAYRAGRSPLTRIADFLPLAMIGYAGYEAACIFRDGCFGPHTGIGLRPPGVEATMLPIGLFIAVAVATAALGVRRLASSGAPRAVVIATSALSVAVVRAAGSVWLPHIGNGLTRQHLTSIWVGVGTIFLLVGLTVVRVRGGSGRDRQPTNLPHRSL